MKVRAAVAHAAGAPLVVESVDLEGPREGEVLVEVKATGICHTDAFTLSGDDPEGIFPSILGHEGAGIVQEVGPGVTSVEVGDHVIPLYTPECRQCEYCLSGKTNLCQAIRVTQGQGLMPDGSSRFSLGGEKLYHYMGTSTFSNFTVLPEIAVAKIRKDAPFDSLPELRLIRIAWRRLERGRHSLELSRFRIELDSKKVAVAQVGTTFARTQPVPN